MRILFICSDTIETGLDRRMKNYPLNEQAGIQFGISYISSIVKNHGHTTELYIISKKRNWHDLNQTIKSFNPGIIACSAVFREYDVINEAAGYIKKKYPNILLSAGGVHVTINPQLLTESQFDVFCVGEGEKPFLEMVTRIENNESIDTIKNLWIKKDDKIVRNPTREYICNLDILPFPDRMMWQKWIKNKNSPHTIIIGRGCPFQCTYCCNHALNKVATGQYVRFRSPENIILEIKSILSDFPDTERIYFEAEAINVNIQYLSELCEKLQEFNKVCKKTIMYGANIRIIPSQNYNNIFKMFLMSNIYFINIGLESGSERIKKDIMKRSYTNENIISIMKAAKKYRLHTNLYVMIGLPTETNDDIKKTMELTRGLEPDNVQINIFFPYPGTDLYNYCLENNLISKNLKDHGRCKAVINYPELSRRKIQKIFFRFLPYVYASDKFEYLWFCFLMKVVYSFKISLLHRYAVKKLNAKIKEKKNKR